MHLRTRIGDLQRQMWKLFPVKGKLPALAGDWRGHATSDPEQIEAWREAGYGLAVDCGASGLLVIDADGAEGLASVATMDLPPTYTMQTPRGGRHFYYTGSGPSTVCKLAPKVDTRGIGGYVVWEAPGYELLNEQPLVALPAHVSEAIVVQKDRKSAATDSLNLPHNTKRALAYLSIRKPAVEGEGGNDHTYQTAAALRDLGISADTALSLMLDGWNDRCVPPWQDDDLRTIVDNAWRYGQNEEAAQALVGEPARRFQDVLVPATPEKEPKFRLWSVDEARKRPPPSWLFHGILPARSVGVAYGPQETGKTWLVLDMALRVATGLTLGNEETDPQDVIFFCGEGFEDLVHSRISAWCAYHAVDPALPHFKLLESFPDVADEDDVDLLVDEIIKLGLHPRLMVLDTYARVMAQAGLNENDPLDVMKFVAQTESLKRGFGCTILSIHHSGKDLERQARGSNSLMAAVDFGFEITADWSVLALRLSCAKMKAAKRFEPLHYEAVPHEDSLIMRGITASAYQALTRVEDTFNSRSVGAALAKLGAIDQAHAVSGHVLASTLYVAQVGEPEMEVQAKVDRIARKLTALGKGRLEQYVSKAGWSFPG